MEVFSGAHSFLFFPGCYCLVYNGGEMTVVVIIQEIRLNK